MLSWLYAAFIGLLTGYVARFLLPGRDSMGMLKTMLVGLVGAFVGNALGHATGRVQQNARAGWWWSVLGAILVLIAGRVLF